MKIKKSKIKDKEMNIFHHYGYMIIPKGSILYHMNDESVFRYKSIEEKPFLFCTFHPSEYHEQYYIHYIKLKKDLKILFMIENMYEDRIYSALPQISGYKLILKYLLSMELLVLHQMRDLFIKTKLDGWFSSINNLTNVEVGLLNKPDIFRCVKSIELKKKWKNGRNDENDNQILKDWRKFYEISFIEKPIQLYVNERFKKIFKKYKKYEKESGFIHEYIFQMMLDNIKINYYK